MTLTIPSFPNRALPIMSSLTKESVGLEVARLTSNLPSSTAWGTANQARYTPFWVPEPTTVVKLLAFNGGTTGGNTDIGLFDSEGAEVISIAAAAQAGTNNWQEFDVTDTPVMPGLYYVGLLNTTTTGTFFAITFTVPFMRSIGLFSQAVGAGNLPSPTATFAAYDATFLPVVGIASRATI